MAGGAGALPRPHDQRTLSFQFCQRLILFRFNFRFIDLELYIVACWTDPYSRKNAPPPPQKKKMPLS